MKFSDFINRPKLRKLPRKEQLRRHKQHLLALSSRARVKPGKTYAAAVKKPTKVIIRRKRPVIVRPQAPKIMKKSQNASKVDKAYGMQTGRLSLPKFDPNRLLNVYPLTPYKGPQGFLIFPIRYQIARDPLQTDGSGNLAYNLQITAGLFPQVTAEALRYKRFRLKELSFYLRSKVGLNADGSASMYINYSGDNTAPTSIADISKREFSYNGMQPIKDYAYRWRSQDNRDTEFVAVSTSAAWNSTGHYFKLYGDSMLSNKKVWDLYVEAVVEYTEFFA